jgi:hypothetical protein
MAIEKPIPCPFGNALMTVVDYPEAQDITPNEFDVDLVHWHRMPDRQQALQFSAQGWALFEALAQFGEYVKPQHLVGRRSVEGGARSARRETEFKVIFTCADAALAGSVPFDFYWSC